MRSLQLSLLFISTSHHRCLGLGTRCYVHSPIADDDSRCKLLRLFILDVQCRFALLYVALCGLAFLTVSRREFYEKDQLLVARFCAVLFHCRGADSLLSGQDHKTCGRLPRGQRARYMGATNCAAVDETHSRQSRYCCPNHDWGRLDDSG